ncbi:MAG TPA: ergothioneine biosynthesis protein EgtB [Ilumatobacteraceae bacterium]|nr:ergothioneine biosynthesis protein EgtB [Ilumatobacteraceae bacterium]
MGTQTLVSSDLLTHYLDVRSTTERLAAPLHPEDQVVQSMPDVSPTKWHRAHVTWFFETFLLKDHLPGYIEHHPQYGFLFNSYYEQVGERHPRSTRGLLSRPTVDEVAAYRAYVDAAMVELLEDCNDPSLLELVELGLHHEQQHEELLLMDIKHVLSVNPLQPAYRAAAGRSGSAPDAVEWIEFGGGLADIGYDGDDGFCFDNEGPRHTTFLQPFALADRLVTNSEWLEFVDDGGYQRPELWLSDGWATVQADEWTAPMYWRDDNTLFTLAGIQPLGLDEPVFHVSFYEADAYARWADARLPTEAEWEVASQSADLSRPANLLDADQLHPAAAPAGDGLRQMFGDVWEWTSSAYLAYPGYKPSEGAVGEYNGKFMSGQMVLRGGCAVTPPGHIRATYRNFFPPHARWAFSGVRLAR